MSHNKFPSIEGFHTVRRYRPDYATQVQYRGKVKLHGTNAGVQVKPNGEVMAQSRSRFISPTDDNAGFARWVEENREFFSALAQGSVMTSIGGLAPMTIHGEWCGQGIMKGASICQVERKLFAVFAIQYGPTEGEGTIMVIEPDTIQNTIGDHEDIFVLPWYGEPMMADFDDEDSLRDFVDAVSKMVEDVEACDPWVRETFGVEGTGEGLVLMPGDGTPILREVCSRLMFKAKGQKHQVVKQKKAIQMDPETAATVAEFVDLMVTPVRLEQGVRETNRGELVFEMKSMGAFLGWVGKDVKKESVAELDQSGLEWKDVSKAVTARAREWFMEQHETI